jgi:hypothetical protein
MSRLLKLTEPLKLAFKECVKTRNSACIINKYDTKAVLKGTFAGKTVQGRDSIKKYFKKLFKNVDNVNFEKDPIIFKNNDLIFECGNYTFIKCDGEKIKANYQFIYNPLDEMKILSHFSSFS